MDYIYISLPSEVYRIDDWRLYVLKEIRKLSQKVVPLSDLEIWFYDPIM